LLRRSLCLLPESAAATVRSRFVRIGERWVIESSAIKLSDGIATRDRLIAQLDAAARAAEAKRAAAVADAAVAHAKLTARLAEAQSEAEAAVKVGRTLVARRRAAEERAAAVEAMADALRIQVEGLQQQLVELSAQVVQSAHAREQVLNSTVWKLTWPARRFADAVKAAGRASRSLRHRLRDICKRYRFSAASESGSIVGDPIATAGPSSSALRPHLSGGDAAPCLRAPGEVLQPDVAAAIEKAPAFETPLDLFDNRQVESASGLPAAVIIWGQQSVELIRDPWAAARWVLDLLRDRADLRSRFPRALSDGAEGAFAAWITGKEGRCLHLSDEARSHIAAAFAAEPAARARQYYFWREDLRAAIPLALLPPGRCDFAGWLLRNRNESQLRLEEIWWLLLQCAEDPAGELVRTYLFTPAWQKAHPDGLTLFGRDQFASWLSNYYGLPEDAKWLRSRPWPVRLSALEHIRLAHAARDDWRLVHPHAFRTEPEAQAFITWLARDAPGLSWENRAWCAARLQDGTAAGLAAPGANIIGHFCYPSGLRVSAEAIAEAIELAGGVVSRRDIRTLPGDEPQHTDFGGLEPHDVTIIHVQPEPLFDSAFDRSDLMERMPRTYRIAYWYWELEAAPAYWAETALAVNEIWAATNFVADALRKVSPVPVRTLFPGVRIGAFTPRSRRAFGLHGREEGRYAFLFSFHMASVMERKNPLGLIRAFRKAFRPEEPVDLVLKTTSFGRYDAQVDELCTAAAGANIAVLDKVLTPEEILSLTDACDAYVSLHRSEGLGLGMAEAMLLGKPVIATRYSGNLDFMDDGNSLLVDYDLVQLGRPVPPYDQDACWAEPSIGHAAQLMRRLYDNRPWAGQLGAAAQRDARVRLAPAAAGKRFMQRLAEIKGPPSSRSDRA
jgi:glycosyltransferase involved in cell wall biosynthesis